MHLKHCLTPDNMLSAMACLRQRLAYRLVHVHILMRFLISCGQWRGRLTGTMPEIGIGVPGLDPKQFPYLGLGGDLYSDFCKCPIETHWRQSGSSCLSPSHGVVCGDIHHACCFSYSHQHESGSCMLPQHAVAVHAILSQPMVLALQLQVFRRCFMR